MLIFKIVISISFSFWGWGAGQREREKESLAGSMPSTEPDVGLILQP